MKKNISELILAMAAGIPDRQAVIDGARTITFRELDGEISLLAAGFARAGITPGMRVALMVPPSIEFVTLTFAKNLQDIKMANRHFNKFIMRLKYQYSDLKYISIIEFFVFDAFHIILMIYYNRA